MVKDAERARPATTRSQQKAATRDRMLAAASELFAERDYGDVTIADIATRAGVAHGLLFHHFSNKQGIYRAVLDGVVAQMDSAFTTPVGADTPTVIRAALRTHLSYLATHRGVALRLIVGRRHTDPTVAAVTERGRTRALTALAQSLGLDPANKLMQFVGATLVAAFDEASSWWLNDPDPIPVDALVTSFIELGIGALKGVQHLEGCPDLHGPIATLSSAAAMDHRGQIS
ncbi:TetR/AcrR family transcriptional regulator [Gordonia rubripertincta]|uniref:TetR/AcrR family transcriptional regulator n=1 Tax=Gordonia rubripertincta TaxID=36822 RepID=A0ABT4MUB3_GORRU|nr:TetR/AcrR family transcriptional regulator [Gordonia rubripertincta]MCZ4549856.1 TetR/AcrR family transcriptional regulator [Gordonia rubripertincta]